MSRSCYVSVVSVLAVSNGPIVLEEARSEGPVTVPVD